LLLIVAGLCLTGSANELVTLFLALELISIPTYVILYLPRFDNASQEAAAKYFLLSVFSSAFLLFGFSYLYGVTGTTNIPALIDALNQTRSTVRPPMTVPVPALALGALVMIVVGLGFKITAVPFHFYAPDVYQGTATVVAALLAFIPKVAGFVALFRVLGFVLAGQAGNIPTAYGSQLPVLLWILAAVTMTLGNILALLQNNLKRLLAYSSVAHAGYMLIGLAVAYNLSWQAGPGEVPPERDALASIPAGVQAVLFYLTAYGAMTIGAFAVIAFLSTKERPVELEDDLAGLGTSHPGIALIMAVFLFSLIGMPLTAGFAGKFWLFFNALAVKGERATQFYWLAGVGAINAAIGGWYYLRILAKMYLHSSVRPLERAPSWPALMALWVCAFLTIFLGVYPYPFVEFLGQR
jgi:NADH-quinone oxidoreductase subunit N